MVLTKHTDNKIDTLLNMFKEQANIGFIYVSNDLAETEHILVKEQPKVVFLDLDAISEPLKYFVRVRKLLLAQTYFIGITNQLDMAIKAFKVDFNDVFVKPSDMLEAEKILARFKRHQKAQTKVIRFKSYRDYIYLKPKEILYLKADNYTTDIYLRTGEVVGSLQTLKSFVPLLPHQFRRIQKSYIINTSHLYFVDEGKKRCRLLGVSQEFKFSTKYIDAKIPLQRIAE